ncbi:MAG: 4Fe-4S binding protein [Desulfobacteraceae bacterium]|jgi:MauM/NapG family ferredoxin protein|nr:MAG: 4Fe-4S binding protein [Desulfobacteraceae bacterium]
MRFQRIIQIPLFIVFVLLILLASHPVPEYLEVDVFLRLDPLISLGSMAATRAFIPKAALALLVLLCALLLGRIFCGYICPMGATIDFADKLLLRKKPEENSPERDGAYRHFKYLFLAGLAGSAVLGISWVFFFSPLSLATRFFSLVVQPVIMLFGNFLLDAARPLLIHVGLDHLAMVHWAMPRYNTNMFVAFFVFGILSFGLIRPRFWCRNLCPAGAIVALFSMRPFFRRTVSDQCSRCGRCARECPMGAISESFTLTSYSECVACLRCREICPEKAISFKWSGNPDSAKAAVNLSRRKILKAGAVGMAGAAVTMTGLKHLHGGEEPRPLKSSNLIRPPGALPEVEFQARCVRCGECSKACPTNTLQPVWLVAGISGLFSPCVTPRIGGCEQECNLCGRVCPTGAIRPIDIQEKIFAKIGTARIIKSRCIAWEQDRKCLICDEICPYNAITSRLAADHPVTVPVIDEKRCNGCGYCENKCPVEGESAIVVESAGEIRLSKGSYRKEAERLGLIFHSEAGQEDHVFEDPQKTLPPGFEESR